MGVGFSRSFPVSLKKMLGSMYVFSNAMKESRRLCVELRPEIKDTLAFNI